MLNGPPGDVLTLAEAAAYLRLPEAEVAGKRARVNCLEQFTLALSPVPYRSAKRLSVPDTLKPFQSTVNQPLRDQDICVIE